MENMSTPCPWKQNYVFNIDKISTEKQPKMMVEMGLSLAFKNGMGGEEEIRQRGKKALL